MFSMLPVHLGLLLPVKRARPKSGRLTGVEMNCAEPEPKQNEPFWCVHFVQWTLLFVWFKSLWVVPFQSETHADGLRNPKTGVTRVQGVSPATFGWLIPFWAPAVAHYQNLPVSNGSRQWHSRRAAKAAHGSALSCWNWWGNGVHILYIQVNVLFCGFFFFVFFYSPN